jgi:hypothetical protein
MRQGKGKRKTVNSSWTGGRPSRRGQVTGTAVLAGDAGLGLGPARGATLDHGDGDQERGGRDGGHDLAPGVRLGLGEVGTRTAGGVR